MNKQIIDLLYQSFDRELNEQENLDLQLAIENSPELQDLKGSIEELRGKLAQFRNQSFSAEFETQLMKRVSDIKPINKEDIILFREINQSFKRIAIAAAFLILSLFVINILSNDGLSIPSQSTQQTIEDEIESSLANIF